MLYPLPHRGGGHFLDQSNTYKKVLLPQTADAKGYVHCWDTILTPIACLPKEMHDLQPQFVPSKNVIMCLQNAFATARMSTIWAIPLSVTLVISQLRKCQMKLLIKTMQHNIL